MKLFTDIENRYITVGEFHMILDGSSDFGETVHLDSKNLQFNVSNTLTGLGNTAQRESTKELKLLIFPL